MSCASNPPKLTRPCCASKLAARCFAETSRVKRLGRVNAIRRGGQRHRQRPGHSHRNATATEWCDRRLLARIHRLTVGTLRKQVEPVNPAQFMRWLLRWQHVAPWTQVLGERGTLEVLQQMQGYEAPANAWERQILARRIADYDPKVLDHLSPHRRGRLGPPVSASRHA